MKRSDISSSATLQPARRRILTSALALSGLSAFARHATAALVLTPAQTPGPFYPLDLPLDSDNDLVSVKGRPHDAKGEVLHLFGRVLDSTGEPLAGSRVEIWQCDARGYYHHPGDRGGQADPNFQGFGHTASDEESRYRFRTLVPVSYPGRTPHIHFSVSAPNGRRLTTQMYIKGHPDNRKDVLFRRIGDESAQASVEVDLTSASDIEAGARSGHFDIVLA